jgi:hypothetical protein
MLDGLHVDLSSVHAHFGLADWLPFTIPACGCGKQVQLEKSSGRYPMADDTAVRSSAMDDNRRQLSITSEVSGNVKSSIE